MENKNVLLYILGIGFGILALSKFTKSMETVEEIDPSILYDLFSEKKETPETNIEGKIIFDGIVKNSKTMKSDFDKYQQIQKIRNIAIENPEFKIAASNAISQIAEDIKSDCYKLWATGYIEDLFT